MFAPDGCKTSKTALQIPFLATYHHGENGGSCGIRTYDQLVKSQLLYQLS